MRDWFGKAHHQSRGRNDKEIFNTVGDARTTHVETRAAGL